jgi:hypothetical protein
MPNDLRTMNEHPFLLGEREAAAGVPADILRWARRPIISKYPRTIIHSFPKERAMKRLVIALAILAVAGSAFAAGVVPDGATGLWRFQDNANKLKATFGNDLTTSNPANSGWMPGPWTMIGVPGNAGLYADGGIVQERSYDYLTCTHGIAPNGGSYVNQYTIAMDYLQTSEVGLWNGDYYNSLFQTNTANGNDGDLFIKGPSRSASVIGTGATGYSTLTFDSSQWHRIVLSVDNSSFFRVYVDGTLFLDAPGQGVDGRFSLDPSVLLFADNDGEDAWGLVGTVATWNRALTTPEVWQMGGWIGGSATPTELLIIPEPATISLLAMGLLGAAVWVWRRR